MGEQHNGNNSNKGLMVKRDLFHGGEAYLEGKPILYRVPRQAMCDGIVYVTEDRNLEGFFETMSIGETIYMGHLTASGKEESILVARQGKIIEEFSTEEATEEKIMYAAVH